jgi:iron(III) transport system ATP-binding protein
VSAIEVHGVAKRFGATPVLTDIDLVIPDGSITALLGASGSGKTTLLRCIAGFERPDRGTISIGEHVVDDGQRMVRAQHRGVGYVPQEGALFPHMTVVGNVAFALSRREKARAHEMLELVGLEEYAHRYPHQLSGGQQQRVALARALANRPKVVLLDEPFSSLDATLRSSLRQDIASVLSETGTTTLMVTHDQDEALSLADQVALIGNGHVIACAEAHELYHDPPTVAAAMSLGEANILAAHAEDGRVTCALGCVEVRASEPAIDGPCLLLLRPEQLLVRTAADAGATHGAVTDVEYHGHDALARIDLVETPGEHVLARVPGDLALAIGENVCVEVTGAGLVWPAFA